MNNQVLLTEQQEQNRTVKGYDIYINGLVEHSKEQKNLYIVKGKYEIEDLTTNDDISPIYQCSCPDFVYRHVRCSHIIAVEFFILGIGA